MKRIFSPLKHLATAAFFLGASTVASMAATISGSFALSGDAYTNAPGLVANTDVTSGSFNLNLGAGASTSFTLFRIWTEEPAVDADDLAARSLLADFSVSGFSTGTVNGALVGVKTGPLQYGQLSWLAPIVLNGPSGSLVVINLSAGTFNFSAANALLPGSGFGYDVLATVTYVIAPVPLPAAGAALLAGLGMLGFVRRRKGAATAA